MIGIDEVGRGSLAGPLLVVAARQVGKMPGGLKDSKLMTQREREKIFDKLASSQILSGAAGNRIAEHQDFGTGLSNCCEFGEGWVEAAEIDRMGLAKALQAGVARALAAIDASSDEEIILDGPVNYVPDTYIQVSCVIKADSSVPAVSAAAIYAKVKRDRYMMKLAKKHPKFGFDRHVGYGTAEHKLAIIELGPLKGVHRFCFEPIRVLN